MSDEPRTPAPEKPTEPAAGTGTPEPPAEPATPPSGFTQRDLDKAAGAARDEGKEVGVNNLLKSLGVDSSEALKTIVQEREAAEEAKRTAAENWEKKFNNQKSRADKLEADLSESQATVTAMVRDRATQLALMEAGVNPERVQAASRLVDADSLEVGEDGTVSGLDEAIEAAKGLAPELFQQPARSVGTEGSSPGTEQIVQPGFNEMDDATFQEMRRRVLFGERIPT